VYIRAKNNNKNKDLLLLLTSLKPHISQYRFS